MASVSEEWPWKKQLNWATYLPLSFKTPKEQEYIAFLWDTFQSNYENKKYQFDFLAYHMLTMSFVYFNIWQIKQTEPKDLTQGSWGSDMTIDLLEPVSLLEAIASVH